jgi:hypothetical protein
MPRHRWTIDPNRGQWTVIAGADAPWIEEHPGQIADVVGMEVGDKYRLQLLEIEAGVDKRRWRAAAAVDDEDAFVYDQRRSNPSAARDGHGRGRRSEEHQLGGHVGPTVLPPSQGPISLTSRLAPTVTRTG